MLDETATTATAPPTTTTLPEISDMKARDMKRELESYGVSTASMFDRADFETALRYARLEGMTVTAASPSSPAEKEFNFAWDGKLGVDDEVLDMNAEPATSTTSPAINKEKKVWGKRRNKDDRDTWSNSGVEDPPVSTNHDTKKKSPPATETRQELFDRAMDMAKKMKVPDLKQELKDRGVEIKAFFDKSDFVKAFADAIADNLPKRTKQPSGSGTTNDGNNKSGSKTYQRRREEVYDASYRDVSMKVLPPGTAVVEPGVVDITDLFYERNEGGWRI
jgi:hypothetical protein